MVQKPLTYNELPEAVSEILRRVCLIESSLLSLPVDEPKDELLNAKQAAEFIQKALPTLYGLVSKRKIPHLKKGKHLMFHRSELLEYLNSGRRKTAEEQEASVNESVDQMLQNAGKSRKAKRTSSVTKNSKS